MPTFDRTALRKGKEAIEQAVASRGDGSGNFRPFLQNIFWKDDQQARYVLFLNPIEEIPEVELHSYVDTGEGVPSMLIARTDPSIQGTSVDPLQEQLGYKPRLTNLAIAVELEPTMKNVQGRNKPAGFEVKTREFDRRIRNDEGELTEEYEEVVAPVIGLVAQSPYNFFNHLSSYDSNDAPINTTPLKITRLGKKDVSYNVVGYDGLEVDRTNLLEYIENVSYISDPVSLLEAIDGLDAVEASTVIGEVLLYQRMEELADEDLYNEILEKAQPPKYGTKKSGEKSKSTRKARPSQRRTTVEVPEESAPEVAVTKGSDLDERLAYLRSKTKTKDNE